MALSTPIYRLKQRAKALSREAGIPLHRALEQIAREHGYPSWSLLAARAGAPRVELFAQLRSGDMLLVAARPGHGKTMLSLEVVGQALAVGRRAVFYTLEYNRREVLDRLRRVGVDPDKADTRLMIDSCDAICADYIQLQQCHAPAGTLIVIDYLQLLDQKRDHPPLDQQVRQLRDFARQRGLIMLFLSQIDRAFECANRSMPLLDDVRLPNPVDLTLFDHACFLNDGKMQLSRPHR